MFPAPVCPTADPPIALIGVKFKACPAVIDLGESSTLAVIDGTTGGLTPDPGNSPPVNPIKGAVGS